MEALSKTIYGIDLGTTNSVVCLWDGEKAIRKTGLVSSVVNLETGEAGPEVKKLLATDAREHLMSSFKVDILQESSVNASALVLKELKRQVPEMVDVVISVPAYFTATQRANTKKAARIAGLKVHGLINEPTAAAIFYSKDVKTLSAVYDLGGGTFDISVIDSRYNIYDVQVTDGLQLGGDQLNRMLRDYLLKKADKRPHHFSDAEMRQLEEEAEKVKINFSSGTTLTVVVDNPLLGVVPISLEEYKGLIGGVFGLTTIRAAKVIREAGYQPSEVKLVFVGGSTKCPYLREMVTNALGISDASYGIDPDYTVAEGAAYYAYLISTGQAQRQVADITKAIGIGLADGTMLKIIPDDASLPFSANHMVFNHEEAKGLDLPIYQGNSALFVNNHFLGRLQYDYQELKAPYTGGVDVRMSMDPSGVLVVKAKELGGVEIAIELKV